MIKKFKKIVLVIICIWLIMSIYLSVKVWNWQNVAYKNYGYNNPYREVMSDVEFTRLEARDMEEEIDKETNIYIPITIWYGAKAKVIFYRFYRSYYEDGKLFNGTDGFGTIDLKLKDGKWNIEYLEGWY